MKIFKNPLDLENIGIKKAIRQWVAERFELENAASVEIIEHNCTEASCVYAETVIHIPDLAADTEGGAFYKITKPLVFVRKIDIALMQYIPTKPKPHKH